MFDIILLFSDYISYVSTANEEISTISFSCGVKFVYTLYKKGFKDKMYFLSCFSPRLSICT